MKRWSLINPSADSDLFNGQQKLCLVPQTNTLNIVYNTKISAVPTRCPRKPVQIRQNCNFFDAKVGTRSQVYLDARTKKNVL